MRLTPWVLSVGLVAVGCVQKGGDGTGGAGGATAQGGAGGGGAPAIDAGSIELGQGLDASAGDSRGTPDAPGADLSVAPDAGRPSDAASSDTLAATSDAVIADAAAPDAPGAAPRTGLCTTEGWCWTNPLPQGDAYFAIFAGSASDVWFTATSVGHWNGSQLSFPPTVPKGVAWLVGSSANDLWGVDAYGGITRYDGRAWTPGVSAPMTFVQDVYFGGPNDLWLVGKHLLHWNGAQWRSMPDYEMSGNGVGGTGPNNVWLASASWGVFRYDGQSWTKIATKTSLYDIQPVSQTQAWACDKGGTSDLHLIDGGTVTPQGLFDRDSRCSDIWLAPGGTLWAVGGGRVYRKKGAAPWTMVGTGQLAGLYTIGGTADEVFVAGSAGLILRAKNAGGDTLVWDHLAGGRSAVSHRRIWAGPGVAWTASPTARGLFRWDGQAWQPGWATPDNLAINAVHGTGPGDLWAVGEKGLIAHHDGTTWQVQQSNTSPFALNAVWAVSATDVWAAGTNGRVLRYDGQRWQQVSTLLGTDYVDIWADATGGYAVSGSTFAHYRNDPPRMVELDPPVDSPSSVWGLPAGPIYVGSQDNGRGRGVVARFDGAARTTPELRGPWTRFPDLAGNDAGLDARFINAIWGTAANDVWATGSSAAGAATYHFDGQRWHRQHVGAQPYFGMRDVFGTARDVWVVGDEDAILRLQR